MIWLGWHVIAGYARQHRLRALVQVLAIAVGVALGYAVHLINTSALAEFASAVRAVTGQADASITATREGFDESVFERVAAHPAVELASASLEVEVPVLDAGAGRTPLLPIVGIDVFRAAALAATLLPQPAEDAAASRRSAMACSCRRQRCSASACGPAMNCRSRWGTRRVALPVVGTVPGARDGQVVGVMDLAFAQWRLDRLGRLTRIDLKLAAGTTVERIAQDLALPPGVAITGADAETTRVSNLSRAYRVNLNVLALVALFTGGFLVFSLQAQATIARRSQLAFLRVLGVTARQVQALLIAEASLLGA
jgi:putative ABC transport system permease protein